jgi:hypothetical protein
MLSACESKPQHFQPQMPKRKQLSFRIPRSGLIIRRRFVDSQSNAGTTSVWLLSNKSLGAAWPVEDPVARFLLRMSQAVDQKSAGKAVRDV